MSTPATSCSLQEMSRARYVSSYEVALIHLGLGEADEALQCLNKAVDERSGWQPYLANAIRLDPLRTSTGFLEVAARVGLPPHSNPGERTRWHITFRSAGSPAHKL